MYESGNDVASGTAIHTAAWARLLKVQEGLGTRLLVVMYSRATVI